MRTKLLFLSALIFSSFQLFAQAEPLATKPLPKAKPSDSINLKLKKDEFADEKNALRSLVLPGWGQVVNKEPIKGAAFLGLFAGGLYTSIDKGKEFKRYDEAYTSRIQLLQEDMDPTDEFAGILELQELYDERKAKQSTKDIATGATVYVMIFNLVDAAAQYKIKNEEPRPHSATKAAYYSAILPGLGQAYNKKYWKIPIVYGALGASTYVALSNRDFYRDYKAEFEFRAAGETTGFRSSLSDQKIEEGIEYWRKWRDIAYVSTGAIYLLNVLDATVDAHLFDFNVDEDLAFKPSPVIDEINGNLYYGINFTFDLTQK